MPISELDVGEKKSLNIMERISSYKSEGIFAIENICPHMNLPLDIGQITDEGTILCPYHNSEFCFRSGEVRNGLDYNLKKLKRL